MKIQVHDIAIEYEFDGPDDAPVVMLHHSLATSHQMWEDLAIALTQVNRVLRFDARGHGLSDGPDGTYDFEMLAGDVTGLMDALGINKAHHVGISMGGMVSQYLGIHAPERVHSLTLVSTTSNMAREAGPIWAQRIKDVRANGMAPQVEGTIKRWFTKDFRDMGDEVIDQISDLIMRTPVNGYCGWGAAIRDLALTDQLGKISAPTQVIVGANDPGTPPADSQVIADGIKGAKLHNFEDASHMLPLQQPDRFIETLIDFLNELDEQDEEDAA
ncbi:MAG: 3-oxoadipate enol-lactonase [bacterium]|nr:3-oxoadipate enol-lactonase [bacterium]